MLSKQDFLKAHELRVRCHLSCLMRAEILRILLRFAPFSPVAHSGDSLLIDTNVEVQTYRPLGSDLCPAKLMAMPLYFFRLSGLVPVDSI
jgi:hypothetical protein